jgi:hypothetical protein
MKTVTIIAEQMTDRMLVAATPTGGVVSVMVREADSTLSDVTEIAGRRAFRNPTRFNPRYRIDMVVDDVLDGDVIVVVTTLDVLEVAAGEESMLNACVETNLT